MQQEQTTPANEAIGFQKGEFMNDMADIVKTTRARMEEGEMKPDDWQKVSVDVSACVAKHTNIVGWVMIMTSREFNAYATLAPLLPMNVHLLGTKSLTKGAAKEQLKLSKKFFATIGTKKLEGKVDIQNSKVYGDFANIGYLIRINIGVFSDKRASDRTAAFAIVHEVGHIFNQIAAIAETVSLAFQTAETFSMLMKAKPTEFKAVLDYSAKKIDYKNSNVIREAAEADDAQTAFMIYAPKTIKEYMTSFSVRDPHSSYSSNSLELAADTFAIRHGGYREFLQIRSLFAKHVTRTHFTAILATHIVVSAVLKSMLRWSFKHLALSAVATGAAVSGAVFVLLGIISQVAMVRFLGTPALDLVKGKVIRPTNLGDYGEYIKRELAERAKEVDLDKDELAEMQEIVKEADDLVASNSLKDSIILRFVEETIYGTNSPASVKDYANSVSSLMSNQLFIHAKLLEAETQA